MHLSTYPQTGCPIAWARSHRNSWHDAIQCDRYGMQASTAQTRCTPNTRMKLDDSRTKRLETSQVCLPIYSKDRFQWDQLDSQSLDIGCSAIDNRPGKIVQGTTGSKSRILKNDSHESAKRNGNSRIPSSLFFFHIIALSFTRVRSW